MASLHVITIYKLLVIFIFCCTSFYASALTPAGTRITHQSQVTYFDSGLGRNIVLISNISTIIVGRIYDFEVIDNSNAIGRAETLASSGTTASIPFSIKNTSNIEDTYIININNLSGDNGDLYTHTSGEIKIYDDVNANGVLDFGERELSKDSNGDYKTSIFGIDEINSYIYLISIPRGVDDGVFYNLGVNVSSFGNSVIEKLGDVKIVVNNGAIVNLRINNAPLCSEYLEPLDEVKYTVNYDSNGNKTPDESPLEYLVHSRNEFGEQFSSYLNGILISVSLPANVSLKPDKIKVDGTPLREHMPTNILTPSSGSGFYGGLVVVGINNSFLLDQENTSLDWHDYGTWNGEGNVEKIAFLISSYFMNPGQSGHFSYYLEANKVLPRGDSSPLEVYSEAEIELFTTDNSVMRSNKVCNTLYDDKTPLSVNNKSVSFQSFKPSLFSGDSRNNLVEHFNDEHFIDNRLYFVKETDDFDIKLDAINARIELTEANKHNSVIDIIGPENSEYPIKVRTEKGEDSFHWMFAETGTNTGIFRSVIPLHASLINEDFNRTKLDHCLDGVNSSDVPSGTGYGFSTFADLKLGISALINFNAEFLNGTTSENCEIQSEMDDTLYLEVRRRGLESVLLNTTAKISPEFSVFDTTTFNTVENVNVHFYQTTNGAHPDGKVKVPNIDNYMAPIASVRTNERGMAPYPKLKSSETEEYFIYVEPPSGFAWPSSSTDLDAFGNLDVRPESYGPFGNEDIANSGTFIISDGSLFKMFDIPIDPSAVERRLTINKTADKKIADVGSFVKYTVTVTNTLTDGSVFNTKVFDQIPYGFKYVEGTARLNDIKIDDPTANENKDMFIFSIGELKGTNIGPTNGVYTLNYLLQLTPGSVDSDGINYAHAEASTMSSGADNRIISNVDNFQVIPSQTGVISDNGIIFGRVFIDAKCNQLMKSNIWPIGGVKIYLETGDYVITDENGQYSMFGIKPGKHILKVDRETLPDGIEFSSRNNRYAGTPYSQFVDLLSGEMHKSDFVAPCPINNQKEIFQELKQRNKDINGDWLFQKQVKSNGKKNISTNRVKSSDLISGITNGPKRSYKQVNKSDSKHSSFKGHALELFKGERVESEKFIEKLPLNVKNKAYIYPIDENVLSVRVGFSNNEENLKKLHQKLVDYKVVSEIKDTSYDRISEDNKLKIDNLLEDQVPLPKKEVSNITRSEAKVGTWYWPKGEYSYDGRFIVVVRSDVIPYLYINDELVNDSQLGERIINKREKAQILAWYGVGLKGGKNLVQIKTRDTFGNQRILLEKEFYHPKSVKNIELLTQDKTLEADGGRSAVPITLKLTDENGNLARGINFVTISNNMGLPWLEPDIQKPVNGHQVRVINGIKTIYLRSNYRTGNVKVQAQLNDLNDDIEIYLTEEKRPLFVNGILNYTGKYGKFSGVEPSLHKNGFENKKYTDDGRAAIFMKGNIKGGLHLTLSYDSKKEDEELQRELSPDSLYPAPGDASIRGYDARSTSKLFVKLEKDRSYAMWGDFSTLDGASNYDLARTSQILNGFSGAFDTDSLRVQLYGALSEDLHQIEEVPGNGTAMDYTLTNRKLIRHSDIVSLITYSRDNPGLILEERSLKRYVDYTIDYFTGTIKFNQVIPMFDEDFNPVKIRIAYDLNGDGKKYEIIGTRVFYQFNSYLDLGFSYEYNSSDFNGHHLGGIWFKYNLNNKTEIEASVATLSHDRLSENEAIGATALTDTTQKVSNAMAYKLKLKRDWSSGGLSELEYSYAEDDFLNPTASVVAGRQEFKLRHRQKLSGLMNLNINASHSEQLSNKDQQQSVSVNIDSKVLGTKWTTTLGSRYIKNKTDNKTESYTTAILGLGRSFDLFNKPGRINTEYERSFGHKSKQRFNIKADWQFHKQASVYGQYEYIDSLSGISNLGSGTTSQLTAGIDVDWLHGGSTFNEFRQRGVSDGRILELANGYRGKFEITPGISVDPSVEYVEVLKGEKESGFAFSLGAADIRNPNYKTTGRVEFRKGDKENYYGLVGAWITRLNQDWSGLVRDEYRYVDKKDDKNTWNNHLSIAAAYRPRLTNNYHLLTSYEWKVEKNEDKREAHIFSTHQNIEWSNDWILSGRIGVKVEDYTYYDEYYDSITTIADARLIYNFDNRLDFDVHGGILGTDWFDSRRYSLGIGANYLVYKNVRLGIGYNFIGFVDSDLDPQGYNLDGFYFDIMFAVDEKLFGWLSE